MVKTNDPVTQRVHSENAERMSLASFVGGLPGVPGQQVRFANPQTMQQALAIALSVSEAEKLNKANEIFFANADRRSGRSSYNSRESKNAKQATNASNQRKNHKQDTADLRRFECEVGDTLLAIVLPDTRRERVLKPNPAEETQADVQGVRAGEKQNSQENQEAPA
jgi:hypothetical protein